MRGKKKPAPLHPERVLQFGDGNFLRGTIDWILHRMNQQGLFHGQAVVIQPAAQGLADTINEQNGLYTLLQRGIRNGNTVDQAELITSIRRAINPYADYNVFLNCAMNPDLRFIVSDTSEAGIVFDQNNSYHDAPPSTYPGKLTVFLHKRFTAFRGDPSKALIFLPCELIERNGHRLKQIVLRYARKWQLGEKFMNWLEYNHFLNTIVDRIVTGYPKDDIEQLTRRFGYVDHLLNTAEPFQLWVIEGEQRLTEELPLADAGLNVTWTKDLSPYRTKIVRILNGAHAFTALAAFLSGKDTVKECVDDSLIFSYMKKGIFEEIVPTLDLPSEELHSYAESVLERFANPYIKHYLLSIAVYSVSKFKNRVLPSLLEYRNRTGTLPPVLCFSLAALILFYRGERLDKEVLYGQRNGEHYKIQDDRPNLEFFRELWTIYDGSPDALHHLVKEALSHQQLWGTNLNQINGLTEDITHYLTLMLRIGPRDAIKQMLSGYEAAVAR